MEVHKDVPQGSIGAPCQDLSVVGEHAGAERGSGTRSSLIHDALDKAVAGGADLIVAVRLQRRLTAVNDTRGTL